MGVQSVPSHGESGIPDDAVHLRLRRAAREALSPTRLAGWRASLETSAQDMFDRLAVDGPVDLVREFAQPWSLAVAIIATGAGGDTEHLAALAGDVFAAAAEPCDSASHARAELATLELARSFESEIAWLDVQAFVALSQTLPCFLGNAWLALIEHPAEMNQLRKHPRLMPRAVEELLRYAGPAHAQFRQALTSVEIGGAVIAQGEHSVLMLATANRDPAQFSEPHRLDLRRPIPGHLAFGWGAHACVGAPLVRLAAAAATRAFLEHCAAAELSGRVEWRGGFAIRGLASLPVVSRRPSPVFVAESMNPAGARKRSS